MICKKITSTKDILSREASSLCNIFNYKAAINTSIHLKKENEDRVCSAKSLLGVLSLVIREGDDLVFIIEGGSNDEKDVALMIDQFFCKE